MKRCGMIANESTLYQVPDEWCASTIFCCPMKAVIFIKPTNKLKIKGNL